MAFIPQGSGYFTHDCKTFGEILKMDEEKTDGDKVVTKEVDDENVDEEKKTDENKMSEPAADIVVMAERPMPRSLRGGPRFVRRAKPLTPIEEPPEAEVARKKKVDEENSPQQHA